MHPSCSHNLQHIQWNPKRKLKPYKNQPEKWIVACPPSASDQINQEIIFTTHNIHASSTSLRNVEIKTLQLPLPTSGPKLHFLTGRIKHIANHGHK